MKYIKYIQGIDKIKLLSIKITVCVFISIVMSGCASLQNVGQIATKQKYLCADVGYSNYNQMIVDEFRSKYFELPVDNSETQRKRALDKILNEENLELADKIELLKNLSPKRTVTRPSQESLMERLIVSVEPQQLPLLKYSIDYDGDYKDMTEYVFHDIDNSCWQDSLVMHFAKTEGVQGVKVLSDVDDTMYANLVDIRYPKGTVYPGVLEFYRALSKEPFKHNGVPLTTLSARPNSTGRLEEDSINGIMKKSDTELCPTALSGEVTSSFLGTLETWMRSLFSNSNDTVSHRNEDKIGEVKFKNFVEYSQVYPEYEYVFVGDSGQADSITATKMVLNGHEEWTDRVLIAFIHDLNENPSHSFQNIQDDLKVTDKSSNPRGIVVFRNYIDAATVAFSHSDKLGDLITADELGQIVLGALEKLKDIQFSHEQGDWKQQLYREYKEDAYRAVAQLRDRGETNIAEKIEVVLIEWDVG